MERENELDTVVVITVVTFLVSIRLTNKPTRSTFMVFTLLHRATVLLHYTGSTSPEWMNWMDRYKYEIKVMFIMVLVIM